MRLLFATTRAVVVLSVLTLSRVAVAQVLHGFASAQTGSPQSILTETSPGVFYGTSFSTVYSITASGVFQPITALNPSTQGNGPLGQLYPASNGLLYGVTEIDEDLNPIGSIFATSLSGKVTTLQAGISKATPLIEASDGNLYGVALISGSYTVFRMSLKGALTPVAVLGQNPPSGPLTQASDGALYGATQLVGTASSYSSGYVFRVSLSGDYSVLALLPEGAGAGTSLTQASNGLLYGGANFAFARCPEVAAFLYTISTSGLVSVVKEISGCAQQVPLFNFNLIEGSDNFIYGTFSGLNGGGVFQMSLDGSSLQSILPIGEMPEPDPQGIIEGSDGNLYLTFYGSVTAHNVTTYGSVFRLIDSPLPPPLPAPQYLIPASGSVGSAVLIYGSQLLGPTAVSFNGVPATKIVSRGQHYIYAVVPPGATTGPITVNTPNGSGTTSGSFQVE